MDYSKKFIITQDESVSNILLAHGFRLVSYIGNTYTFMNETQEKFNFEQFDKKMICFTNNLYM